MTNPSSFINKNRKPANQEAHQVVLTPKTNQEATKGVSPFTHNLSHGLLIDSNKAERIIPALVECIDRMGLGNGDKLPTEKDLCQMLGVGNTSLREALIILRTLGIVEVRHGSGWYVGKFDPTKSLSFLSTLLPKFIGANYNDIMQSRLNTEPIIARLAATHISEKGLVQLEETLSKMEKNADDRFMGEFGQEDKTFHDILGQECGNSIFTLQSSILTGIFYTVQWFLPQGHYGERIQQHRKIFEAIQAKDGDCAEQAMKEHLMDAWEFLKLHNQ